jgi:imidazolonepropionase-like amidohydrolase
MTAQRLKMHDRGHIAVGKRADLLLVRGNPTENIKDTMKIEKVWKKGELSRA